MDKRKVEGLLIAEKLSEILTRHKIPIQDSEPCRGCNGYGNGKVGLQAGHAIQAARAIQAAHALSGRNNSVLFDEELVNAQLLIGDEILNLFYEELDRAREEGRREVYEAIVFDKNIPHDVTTFVAANLWKNMRDKAKEELSKSTTK